MDFQVRGGKKPEQCSEESLFSEKVDTKREQVGRPGHLPGHVSMLWKAMEGYKP